MRLRRRFLLIRRFIWIGLHKIFFLFNFLPLGVLALTEHVKDEGECYEPHKYPISFVKTGEHTGDSPSIAQTISPLPLRSSYNSLSA